MRLLQHGDKSSSAGPRAIISMVGKRRNLLRSGTAASGLTAPLPVAVAGLLGLSLLAAALAIDPFAPEPFVSPKWLLVELGVVGALAALLWRQGITPPRVWPRSAWVIGIAAAGVVLALIASALLAEVPSATVPALRRVLLLAAVPLLGAACGMGEALRRWLLPLLLACLLLNGAVSLLQWMGVQPLPLAQPGGRFPTGALLGNEGLLALFAALLLPPLAVLLTHTWRRDTAVTGAAKQRVVLLALVLLAALLIVLNRQLTAALAASAGVTTVVLLSLRQHGLARAALWGGLLALLLMLLPPTRPLLAVALPDVERIQALSTQRLAAWAAADGMWQASPWHGHGPGSYARQGQSYRLAAEPALQRRLLPPVTATGFAEAHNDYLQLAAEAGLPALLAALLALGLLLDRLFRRAPGDPEARALAGMLVAGAVAALAWFPLQVPLLALMLLLGLGRAWRLIAEPAR